MVRLPVLTSAQKQKRKRLESDPIKWLKHFLAEVYTKPFAKLHLELIEKSIAASREGGRFCVAGERGIGKSAILMGLVLYLVLTGEQEFPICLPWDAKALRRAFRFWRAALCYNTDLLEYYPEYCVPFAHCRGISQKLAATWWADEAQNDFAGKPTGAQLAITEGLIVLPDNRGCLGGATVNGNPRGLFHATHDGRLLRPTLVLLDDVQDRGVAKSERMTEETIQIIDGDIGGMGEAGKTVPMVITGNCIEVGDVMEHYVDNWNSMKIPCVESFPDGWEEGKGNVVDLWREWYSRYEHDDAPNEYYRDNKESMIAGFVLNSPGNYAATDTLPDAYCAVMSAYFKMGHYAFMAEKQQQPVKRTITLYNLDAKTIMSRENRELKPLTVPDWATHVIASSDINRSYALTTTIHAFGVDQRCAVLWHGLHKTKAGGDMTDGQIKAYIMKELEKHGQDLKQFPVNIDLWVIDGGGTPQGTVITFAANSERSTGIRALCCFGRGARQYRPTKAGARKLMIYEQSHLVIESRSSRWCLFNADYWREQAQRGFLGAIGASGSIELYAGDHHDFADQVCRERLSGKNEVGGRMVWMWETLPGAHDYGDCNTMAFVAAAISGIGTGGGVGIAPRKKKKIAVVINGKRIGG